LFASFEEASLESRDDPEAPADSYYIFDQRDVDVWNAQSFHEPRSRLIAAETTYDAAHCAEQSADYGSLRSACGNARARQRAQRYASNQARRRCAARRFRQLVGYKLHDCERGENYDRRKRANQRERAFKFQPAQMRSPRSCSRSRERAQSSKHSNEKGKQKRHCSVLSSFVDLISPRFKLRGDSFYGDSFGGGDSGGDNFGGDNFGGDSFGGDSFGGGFGVVCFAPPSIYISAFLESLVETLAVQTAFAAPMIRFKTSGSIVGVAPI
jgi:hypothetical protein